MVLSRRDFLPCDACAMGKLKITPEINSFHRANNPLDVIHTDLLGPITPCTSLRDEVHPDLHRRPYQILFRLFP